MIIHVVKPGDTIESIAETYQVPSIRLIQENGIKNYDDLVIGQTIVIVNTDKTYIVQEGDTLISIAKENGITLIELLRNNPYLSEGIYFVGDILVISYSEVRKGKMSTNGYAFPFIKMDILRKTLPFLTYLTVVEYTVTSEGVLNDIDDEEIIQIAKNFGVAPLMLITTLLDIGTDGNTMLYNIIMNDELQERFINNVLNVLSTKGYYGLNLFVQLITLELKSKVDEFIQKLTSSLNKEGYLVIGTITPQTIIGIPYKDIDYFTIGQILNGVLLLSYEWGYSFGPPGAATSVSRVREYLDFGVTQIPPEKIHIGIPVIAYNWELPFVPGVSSGNALSIDAAILLASETNSIIQFDEIAQAPYFFYDIGTQDKKTTYIIWFKDARSIDVLTSLVPEYGIAGIAVWNVMNFFAQLWLIINTQYEIVKVI